ncbi:MAG: radical SAM protein [Patescibacteria group bacterium]|jgi:radical SAM superfamily enzyme YgiQ (UPF0313 family)
MKIVFIQPKVKNSSNNFLPLGIGYLAAFLIEHGHKAKIFDLEVQKFSDQELIEKINEFQPDAVGFTVTITSTNEALRLGSIFSKIYKWVFYGGPQATMDPESFLLAENNIVFRKEGELSILEFCDALSSLNDFSNIHGISFLRNGKVIHNQDRELIKDVDLLPFPARDLYPLSLYEMYLRDRKATNIITSRGCPFECIYCFNMAGRTYRPRSAENVLAELLFLKEKYGFQAFSIYDDNFTVNKQRLIDICEGLLSRNIKMVWRCYSRVDTLNEELLKLMKKAGCFEIAFGVESGCQKSLDLMKKRTKVEDSENIIKLCKKVGIVSKAFIMLGFPWETKGDIETTISFVEKIIPNDVQFMCVTPMPNTELWRIVAERGYRIDANVDYTRLKNAVYGTENFTEEELDNLASEARKRYKKAKIKYVFKHPFSFSARIYFNEKARSFLPYKLKRFVRKIQKLLFK